MDAERIALVALLRLRPQKLTWSALTEKVLDAGSARIVFDDYFPPQLIDDPRVSAAWAQAEADLQTWHDEGLEFLSVLDPMFPRRLHDIMQTPPFLFAQGHLVPDDQGFSVVGSRKASPEGEGFAREIATYLAGEGLTVVSGMAAGIDTAAHQAALAVGGRTVAFVATGVNRTYPAQNRHLHESIADLGLVLSQFWPDAPPQKHTFLMRNALMSGYGLASIIVEAGETSGARAQARMAVEHGRPVILTESVVARNHWAKTLIQQRGVHLATDMTDIDRLVTQIREEPARVDTALRELALTHR
uniref:Putative Rossmann fold nucleotide-binding protein involved in DNA uptake n=1 Tax=Rhodococcus sp. NS1 TaxID=402236 RepID=Q06GA6_9NOCA|nr:DNA-processing protein DprA [Rhodococcus sp. NS1]ABI79405.1 putative Rossmann fold nucleotide-binding protein involved in DNA uptake [Rhodococcus sp. NS1]